MEIQGKIIYVLEERSGVAKGSGKPYRVAQYVLETQEQYPKKMLFEVFGDDRINQMNIQIGEVLTVAFDIDAREYNDRWYNTIRAYRVDRAVVAPKQENDTPEELQPFPPAEGSPFPPLDDTSDMPF